jgi:hydrogenase-4 component E
MTVLLQTTGAVQAQWLAAATGGLLLTAVLTLWRRSAKGTVLVLALQGACLALLALTVAASEADVELFAIAVLTLVVKVAVIPTLLSRVATTGEADETTPVINPTTGMLLAAALTTLAYLVTRSLSLPAGAATANAVPVGISVVLIGFLVLITRRQTLTQAVGFVMIDNGIAATALLAAGGLPVVVELGVLIDAVLIVFILIVLSGRIRTQLGSTDLSALRELRD